MEKWRKFGCSIGASGEEQERYMFTAPFDARFPNQNQTRHCYQNYVDYRRCQKKHGDDHPPCHYYLQCARSLCPNSWVEKWDDQVENGTFAGRI